MQPQTDYVRDGRIWMPSRRRARMSPVHVIGGGGGIVGLDGAPMLYKLAPSVTCLRAWQTDFGVTLGGTPLASGTTPPAVTISGSAAGVIGLRIEVQSTTTFRYFADGGTNPIETGKTIPNGGTYAAVGAAAGITFSFPSGTYNSDNVYKGVCAAWTDQKNSGSAAQATAVAQPVVGIGLGGRPKLTFNGTSTFLIDTVLDLPAPSVTPTFIWGVITHTAWAANKDIWFGNSGIGLIQATSTPRLFGFNGTFSSANTAGTLTGTYRIEQRFGNSTADYLKVGATSVTGINTGNTDSTAGWSFGAAASGVNFANVDIYACLIFAGIPSAGELAALSAAAVAMYPGIGT